MEAIRIDALDTLFFRDGKPFTMGEDTWANSVFPPNPSVFSGAIRSLYFAENPQEFRLFQSKGVDPTERLKIKGIYLMVGTQIYYPLPLDCVVEKNKSNEGFFVLTPMEQNGVSNSPTEKVLLSHGNVKVENMDDGLIRKSLLTKYLQSSYQYTYKEKERLRGIKKLSELIISEPRIGIALDKQKKKAEDSNLYRIDMKRMESRLEQSEKLTFLVEYEGLSIPDKGFMKLGGEGKAVTYEIISVNPAPQTVSDSLENEFKLYFASPALFEKGWLPSWITDEEKLTGEYHGIPLKLTTAAVGKYLSIGGFDIKNKKPKPMRRAVPAGSVYYFQVMDPNIGMKDVIDLFHYKNISDYDASQGFGLTFVGGVK